MENQKMVVVINPKMTEAISKYKEADKATSGNYDRRSKANRFAKAYEEEAMAIIKAETEIQAREYLKANGIELSGVAQISVGGYGVYNEINPMAYLEFSRRNEINLSEVSVEEVKEAIAKVVAEKDEENKKETERIEVADKMLQLVKDEVTYKDSSWKYDETKNKWDGSQLNSEFRGEDGSDWSSSARIELRIPSKEKINVDFRVCMDVKSPEEAKEIWDAFQKFVKEKTKFVKKEAN